jgi:PAS domain S-box-containing protein
MAYRADAREGYLAAIVAAAAAVLGRAALNGIIGSRHHFVLLYAASLLVASRWGLGPGLAVVALGALGVAGMGTLPAYAAWGDRFFMLDLAVFVALAVAIAWVAASRQRARTLGEATMRELVRRAEALAQSEERYRSFIQRSSEGIWRFELTSPVAIDLSEEEQIACFHRDGYLAECNDAMARMYGFREASELTGRRLSDVLVPEDPANHEYLLAFIRSGYRITNGESHERDRDGQPKYFLNNLVGTIVNGHVVRAWGTQRDVTDIRRAEQALRASEERLRLALTAGRMGIWDWNLVDGTIQWTDTFEPIEGLPQGSSGPYESFLSFVHVDDRERLTENVRDAIERRAGYEAEFRVVAPNGTMRWMLGKGQVFADAADRPVRMIGVAIDVTIRKRVEEELRRSVFQLEATEREVQQLYGLERQARAEAEQSNRAKDEFLATLSHELRSPLSAALSWAHLLRRGQLDAEKTARGLETIERTTRLQVRLVEDLLDISRIVSGKLTLEHGVVDLRAVVDAAIEAARTAAEARQLDLRVRAPADVLLVGGDAVRLEQVIGNLLGNAIKFTPAGGSITVSLRRDGGDAEITVADTGIGIAPDVLPHVFDRFRQADSSTTRRHGGLGLGLAIVRHLVELHGGAIVAESAGEGQGALMRIRLPLYVAAELGMAAPDVSRRDPVADAAPLGGMRILAVDDEADILAFLETILTGAGATVATAASAGEALARLDVGRPDVIVSDLAMPDRDGFAFLRTLRAGGATMPVIALTALASAADRQRAVAAGFDLYLTKPIDPPMLVAASPVCDGWRSDGPRASDSSPTPDDRARVRTGHVEVVVDRDAYAAGGRCQSTAVGRPRDRGHEIAVARERIGERAALAVVDADELVGAADGDRRAVRAPVEPVQRDGLAARVRHHRPGARARRSSRRRPRASRRATRRRPRCRPASTASSSSAP